MLVGCVLCRGSASKKKEGDKGEKVEEEMEDITADLLVVAHKCVFVLFVFQPRLPLFRCLACFGVRSAACDC